MLIDEIATLHLLSTRKRWARYYRRIPMRALTDTTATIVTDIGQFYAQHESANKIDWDAFAVWWKQDLHAQASPFEHALIDAILARVKSYEPNEQIEAALQSAWAKAGFIQEAAEALIQTRTGQSVEPPDAVLLQLIAAYRDSTGKRVSQGAGLSFRFDENALAAATAKMAGDGYNWRLQDMNIGIGPLRPGDFVLVGGRPELGKTSFVVDQTAHMLREKPATALWINNEEGSHRIMLRYLSVVLKRAAKDLNAHIPAALAAMYKRGWAPEQIQICEAHNLSLGAIEDEIARVNPNFLILHRLDKMPQVRNIKQQLDVQRLAELAFWARQQAASGRVVFGVCQADASANGQKFVYDHQLYGSKTAVQAESDAIITIGAEHVFDKTRGIHLPRNKLVGGAQSNETHRHGFFEVNFDSITGRYETILYGGAA